MKTLDAKSRDAAIGAAARAAVSGVALTLRAASDGAELTQEQRTALLAAAVAREAVSLDVDLLAFEQVAGQRNRNCVRFRDGAMPALGRSGRGTPFLRDHEQGDVRARGGTVQDSSTTKVGEGHYQLLQRVRLTEPSAVERALRGLMSSVSIGWHPTGPVLCSACGTPVLERCWHWPGDAVKLDGGETQVAIEWVFTAAELVETSEVSVPAVPTAGVQGIKAALAAQGFGVRAASTAPGETHMDKIKLALIGLLGLAATASDDEAIDAVGKLKRERDAFSASNLELGRLQAKSAAEAEAARAAIAAAEVEEFIASAMKDGKCSPGSKLEGHLRDFFAVDAPGARALAAELPRVTPVGAPPQRGSGTPSATPAPVLSGAASRIAALSQHASIDGVRRAMAALGKPPAEADRIIASQLAPKEN